MKVITKNINKILERKDISRYKLSQMINYDDSAINAMILGKRSFPDQVVEKLLPILKISREEFEGWVLSDKYPKEIIERTIQIKKEFSYKRKSILTNKIDEILEKKDMSRTALAKQINYSQSGLNRMITGKINMSKPVIEKVSKILDISQDEILSWILADKYKLKSLEIAYNEQK